jgi:hypothetical protein
VAEDWRLSVEVDDGAAELAEKLRAAALEGMDVRNDGKTIVVYADTRTLLEDAVPPGLMATGRLERWHPEHGWKDPERWSEPASATEGGTGPEGGAGPDVAGSVIEGAVEGLWRLLR